MHLRLDDLRKQARMLQMYEAERTRTRSAQGNASIQTSGQSRLSAEGGLGFEMEPRLGSLGSLADPILPKD